MGCHGSKVANSVEASLSSKVSSKTNVHSGTIIVHTPVPDDLHSFTEFGEHNVYLCIEYLSQLGENSGRAATVDAPAHRLAEGYGLQVGDNHAVDVFGAHHVSSVVITDPKAEAAFLLEAYSRAAKAGLLQLQLNPSPAGAPGQPAEPPASPKSAWTAEQQRTQQAELSRALQGLQDPHMHHELDLNTVVQRAHALCFVNRNTLHVSHLRFERALDVAAVKQQLGGIPVKLPDLRAMCAAFARINTSHSGHLTVPQLARFIEARRRHSITSAVDGPAHANPIATGGLLEHTLVFQQLLRLVPPLQANGMTPEEWVMLVYRVGSMGTADLERFIFECLSKRVFRPKQGGSGRDNARSPPADLAVAAAVAARQVGLGAESNLLTERAIAVNSIREEFPVLQDAQTTSHSRNTALLRGLARVYHLRLGQFSRDERIADGVLCKLGDWEDMVETDPEIMACVFEAQKVIMEATLARPTWDTLRADIAALHLPRFKPHPASLQRTHSEVLHLLPLHKPAAHRRLSELSHASPGIGVEARPTAAMVARARRRSALDPRGHKPRRSSALAPGARRHTGTAAGAGAGAGAGAASGRGSGVGGDGSASESGLAGPSRSFTSAVAHSSPLSPSRSGGSRKFVTKPSFFAFSAIDDNPAAEARAASNS